MRKILAFLVCLLAAGPAGAEVFVAQPAQTPIRLAFSPPAAFPEGQELVVSGSNGADGPVTLVIRLDDGASVNYQTRINEERILPPGSFVLRFPTSGLKTLSGRLLDHRDIRRLILAVGPDQPSVTIEKVAVERGIDLPPGVLALDFGGAGSPVFPGFQAVVPGDPRLAGRSPKAIRRVGQDALLGDGIIGIERILLPLADGNWRLTLWTEDPGEWEHLPHFRERRILVNGQRLVQERWTGEDWVRTRYLAGAGPEALADGDAWEVFGKRRGGRLQSDVEIRNGRLVVELAGDGPATYLAALLVEPAGGDAWRTVEEARALRFRETWRIEPQAPGEPVRHLAFGPAPAGPVVPASRPGKETLRAVGAPGSPVRLEMLAVSPDDRPAFFAVEGLAGLMVRTWGTQWQYERAGSSKTLLRPVATRLRADGVGLPLRAGLPRRYVAWVDIPPDAPPGRFTGIASLRSGQEALTLPLEIEVLPARLPEADRPVGAYLEPQPFLAWFPDYREKRREAVACDLRFLRSMGLTGMAPPLATPTPENMESFLGDVAMAEAAGFRSPLVAYTPVKRLLERGFEKAIPQIVEAERRLKALGLPTPAWSIADEPGNHGLADQKLADVSAAIRQAAPSARLLGQLNNPADAKFLKYLDIALVNFGYGADMADLEKIRATGVEPWLYNMGRFRLAGGFYLWRTGARGYLQWHARLPTADPFDPTDGREADIQMLYPSAAACPAQHDIHADLLDLAEGLVDLRWLRWLEVKATKDGAAARLLGELRKAVGDTWKDAIRADDPQLAAWRQRIQDQAKRP